MTRPALSPASTRADRLEQLEGGLQDLACDQCGAAVRVKKLSPQHTSVQWSTRSVRQCAEFALRAGDGRPTALIPTCGQLRDTIERAARDGRLDPAP
jgi:hypothetical protein